MREREHARACAELRAHTQEAPLTRSTVWQHTNRHKLLMHETTSAHTCKHISCQDAYTHTQAHAHHDWLRRRLETAAPECPNWSRQHAARADHDGIRSRGSIRGHDTPDGSVYGAPDTRTCARPHPHASSHVFIQRRRTPCTRINPVRMHWFVQDATERFLCPPQDPLPRNHFMAQCANVVHLRGVF